MSPVRFGVPAHQLVASVVIKTPTSHAKKYCRLRLQNDGCAEIYGGWTKVVKEFQMQEGEVWMFTIEDLKKLPPSRRDQWASVRVEMVKLDPLNT